MHYIIIFLLLWAVVDLLAYRSMCKAGRKKEARKLLHIWNRYLLFAAAILIFIQFIPKLLPE